MLEHRAAVAAPSIAERHVIPSELAPIYHRSNGFCWCQPIVEDVLPNGRIYIHRRTTDSPHREVYLT